MNAPIRVAFFPDCFDEVNGVSRTARELEAFAERRGLPFLSVHAGPETAAATRGSVRQVTLQRSRLAMKLEFDFRYDFLFWRHLPRIRRELEKFQPDLIHVTSPGDAGQLGSYLAHRHGLPLVAGWHTNVDQYARRRLERRTGSRIPRLTHWAGVRTEQAVRALMLKFYRMARLVFAPHAGLVDALGRDLRRPVLLMTRGVDGGLFSPARRRRRDDGELRLGFVGRLSPEKNLRLFQALEERLLGEGHAGLRLLFVGDGAERPWLERNLRRASFSGVLSGAALAEAYADLDIFVFPSETDTYGVAVLEAMASGVPPVVTTAGGPAHIITPGVSGLAAASGPAFLEAVAKLAGDPELRRRLGREARRAALETTWDRVFENVYAGYRQLESAPTSALASRQPVRVYE